MSCENLELVTRAIRAACARPKPDFETVNALFDADHVFVPLGATKLGEQEARGAEGYRDWLQETGETLEWEADFDGAVDIGAHSVLAATSNRFAGAGSGIQFEQRFWLLVTVGEGKITRTEAYTDPAEALEAARSKV